MVPASGPCLKSATLKSAAAVVPGVLSALRWLALEVKDLPTARSFYEDHLGRRPVADADGKVRYAAGPHELRLRRPEAVPRGGVHTHYAFSTPPGRYDEWVARLDGPFDVVEHSFGDARSLYCYDPDGNCVEIGQAPPAGGRPDEGTAADGAERERTAEGAPPLSGLFEVVLEVTALDRAVAFYEALGFEVVDRGADRQRVRLSGPVDLELWEPHLGIADARGGLHVDVGYEGDPVATVAAAADDARTVEETADGVRVCDPDGHWVTVERDV
jgi:catechol 2,3-dioxygenase-like lactoylglutathione lyase family enzyme